MRVELHLLQNFAPSNLNRDDTGAPKDCDFGGYRRARISSQAIKRAMRREFRRDELVSPDRRGTRTKRLTGALVDRLVTTGKDEAESLAVANAAIGAIGLKHQSTGEAAGDFKTQYLVFLGQQEIDRFAETCLEHWDALASGKVLPAGTKKAFVGQLDGGKASDVALFGRMIADLPERNIDAASQVAHAISTNKISAEFDFYTALDDLKPDDTAGADMMGTVEFNSSCFYRYANVDLAQLATNLDDDDLVEPTLEAFLRASVAAIPTGKQNSFAAQNPPSFVLAVVRDAGMWSLANAFVNPVRPDRDGDLIANSIVALDGYWGQLSSVYGDDGIVGAWCVDLTGATLATLDSTKVATFRKLVDNVLAAAGGGAA
ncbi:MAG TPA: type I-E CRISPR-associated protein Cas7/Cse4/CasC [Thermomicrobiales bacterium]|jgi:CRISPR system Cascade subunit CasC|nr:type I-E CRISPR-associated protein Cas7/Cse4/CasC [Thermomicrobiales bacterium]HRA33223.1 type I-E CRISPR-associated protein Cas7/Cse4/CasC [Thermomicrobiales bacterium]